MVLKTDFIPLRNYKILLGSIWFILKENKGPGLVDSILSVTIVGRHPIVRDCSNSDHRVQQHLPLGSPAGNANVCHLKCYGQLLCVHQISCSAAHSVHSGFHCVRRVCISLMISPPTRPREVFMTGQSYSWKVGAPAHQRSGG